MKFTSAFSLLAYALKVGTTQATCGRCLPLPPASKSFQTLRIYNITDPNWTAEQAMEETAKTTALKLAKMPGFQRYTAAATGDSQLVLYMNQFDSEEEAKAAQETVSNSSNGNDGKLELFISLVTEGYASFPEGKCFTESQVGKWLTSALYKYEDPASVDMTDMFNADQDAVVLYTNTPGFVMSYVSTNFPEGSDKSAWTIMESEADEAAYQELVAESNYQWTGPPSEKVFSTAGTIGLDVLCAEHHAADDATDVSVSPPAPATTATAKASKVSSAKSSKTADAKAEKTSSAKAVKEGSVSVKATKEPKAKKTSPPKTAKADKASSAKASKAKPSSKVAKAGTHGHEHTHGDGEIHDHEHPVEDHDHDYEHLVDGDIHDHEHTHADDVTHTHDHPAEDYDHDNEHLVDGDTHGHEHTHGDVNVTHTHDHPSEDNDHDYEHDVDEQA